jgi:hypothetical protein
MIQFSLLIKINNNKIYDIFYKKIDKMNSQT